MFSMTKIKAVNGAGKAFYANHLAANDYYSEKEKVVGIWSGSLAFDFDLLVKRVDTETFSLFQQNINPLTLSKLTQRTVSSGVRFFDFQCAAPKPVSIMALFDRRLLKAHDQAVQEAMIKLERLAAARVGDNVRTNNPEMTGKIVYASFRHDASRTLDPQVHTHNVVVNVTRDSEGKYKALESVEMCRAIRYAGKVYHNELAKRCRELGYDMVNRRDEKGNITLAGYCRCFNMGIHSIKDLVFAAQYDPLSGILILTDAIDPVWGSEKTCQAGWEAGYQVGNERGFSTGYHEVLSNATEGFGGPFS